MNTLKDLRQERFEIESSITSLQNKVARLLEKQEELQNRKAQIDREINVLEGQAANDAITELNLKSEDFLWSQELRENLSAFGMENFRPKQLEIMNATLSKKDVIVIMPTGGGKSLCYQLPALVSKGVTLVITPLISLMENQIYNLQLHNIDAQMLCAATHKDTLKSVHAQMIAKNTNLRLLYITPEKISKSKRFMAQLEKCYKAGNLSRIAVDEVHCASQWGNDFRPDYKILGLLRRQFPDTPIIGLTATSTEKVTEDTKSILNIPYSLVFKTALNRNNLFYEIRRKPDSHKEVIAEIVKRIKDQFKHSSGIIYCFSRKDCETLAEDLSKCGVTSQPYHAQLNNDQRSRVHKQWLNKNIQVICATVAFGMGIDKPDVRFVIHHCLPKSVENYYQESGRAGRDGLPALCLLYYGFSDVFRQSTLVLTENTGLKNLYKMISYCNSNDSCRRRRIMEHFGEKWKASMCKNACDRCCNDQDWEEVNLTTIGKEILRLIQNVTGTQERLTGLKLVECANGKGKNKTSHPGLKALDSNRVKTAILCMVENEFIREDFHFTPYSTISYLELGPRAQSLMDGTRKFLIQVPKQTCDPSTAYLLHRDGFKDGRKRPRDHLNQDNKVIKIS